MGKLSKLADGIKSIHGHLDRAQIQRKPRDMGEYYANMEVAQRLLDKAVGKDEIKAAKIARRNAAKNYPPKQSNSDWLHGADERRDSIQPGVKEPGAWFTKDINYASQYGNEIHRADIDQRKTLTIDFSDSGLPVIDGIERGDLPDNVSLVQYAKDQGYDSAHFPRGNYTEASEAIAVLDGSQISLKSLGGAAGLSASLYTPEQNQTYADEMIAIGRPDLVPRQGTIEGVNNNPSQSAVHHVGNWMQENMNTPFGNPVEGIANYMQNFGNVSTQGERLERAFGAALDVI